MIEVTLNENSFTRDLTVYLENQIKINLSSSGVGLSLVLGFGAAYVCYYLSSVAKVRMWFTEFNLTVLCKTCLL